MQMNSGNPLILVGSPRKKGNCRNIASRIAKRLRGQGQNPDEIFLHDFNITPCIACDLCLKAFKKITAENRLPYPQEMIPAFGCPLTREDQSTTLLAKIWNSSQVFIVSPIYFYHLPAHLKALVDRLQSFWNMGETGVLPAYNLPERLFFPILVAARKKGEKLFEGSLLSLRQALKPLNMQMGEPLQFYGLDLQGDFAADDAAHKRLDEYLEFLFK